jgi:Icc-related predicted phosphoesterase
MSFLVKKKRRKLTSLFFATEIHGLEQTFRKFFKAENIYKVYVIVRGGDISGKLLIPNIKEDYGNSRTSMHGSVHKITTEAELKQLQNTIGSPGFSSQIMEADEHKTLDDHPEEFNKLFLKLARERLAVWMGMTETRLISRTTNRFNIGFCPNLDWTTDPC